MVRRERSISRLVPQGAKVKLIEKATTSVLVLLVLILCTPHSPVYAGPPRSGMGAAPLVKVEVVKSQDITPMEEYVSHVEAIEKVDLRARIEGFIREVRFREGDQVREGQILYVIEQAPYRAKVALAEAEVAQARASVDRTEKHLRRLRFAKPESIRATDIDNALADESSARAKLKAALARLRLARINLDYTVIKAPISGRIGKTAYTRGNLVNLSSGPLATIVRMDPIRAVFWVSEGRITRLMSMCQGTKRGRPKIVIRLRLRLSSGKDYKEIGTLDFMDNKVDPSTGTIAVRAVFPNKLRILIPGQYVTILLPTRAPRTLPVICQRAVQEDRKGRYVLVVGKDNRVLVRRIKTGPITGAKWAVEEGLRPGEKVIVEGVIKVRPGELVKPIVTNEGAQDRG